MRPETIEHTPHLHWTVVPQICKRLEGLTKEEVLELVHSISYLTGKLHIAVSNI